MYIVTEIQKNGDQLSHLVTTHSTRNEAEGQFHQILAAAAVSNVPIHAAAMLSEEGFPLRNECYKHPDAPAEEPLA